jgi:hypothetical protein
MSCGHALGVTCASCFTHKMFAAMDDRERVVLVDPERFWRLQQDHARGLAEARGAFLALGMVGVAVAGGLLAGVARYDVADQARAIIGMARRCPKRLGVPGAWPCILDEGHERSGAPHRERFGHETTLIWTWTGSDYEYVPDEAFERRAK